MADSRRQYWEQHFAAVAEQGNPWLDYSNERVQLQTLGLVLASSGNLIGLRCLDVGCGQGQLSATLAVFGAGEVIGMDMIQTLIDGNRRRYPQVRWECVNFIDRPQVERLGMFDRIYAIEALQYLPIAEAVSFLYGRLNPGGRIVAMFPNSDCPIVKQTTQRCDSQYRGITLGELRQIAESLPDLDFWASRGMAFTVDQRLAPYEISSLTHEPIWQDPPNRLLFVVAKRDSRPVEQ
jgi:2-polyprenyl-3-methyl-5-hydroxy-6-metoxy-1,4-benzoquinol methylase